VKRLEKLRMKRPEDRREIKNLTALADCEQVVRYIFFFEDGDFSYIVLELMEGNLQSRTQGICSCVANTLVWPGHVTRGFCVKWRIVYWGRGSEYILSQLIRSLYKYKYKQYPLNLQRNREKNCN
jgi:serine/threonine protein kinase